MNSAVAPAGSKEWNTGSVIALEGGSSLGQQWEYLSGKFSGSLANISDVQFQYRTALAGQSGAGPSIVGTPLVVGVPEPNYALASWMLLLPVMGLGLLRKRQTTL